MEREAKGRMLVRELMADREFMTGFSAEEREWYLLTSLFADDAGYLVWDLETNAANLYRYETPRHRVHKVRRISAAIERSGRLVVLECTRHALMPRVAKRPRGMRREHGVLTEHYQCIGSALDPLPAPAEASALGVQSSALEVHSASIPYPSVPFHSIPSREESERRRPRGKPSPLRKALIANGIDPDLIGGK